jgi:hypothetical protein
VVDAHRTVQRNSDHRLDASVRTAGCHRRSPILSHSRSGSPR